MKNDPAMEVLTSEIAASGKLIADLSTKLRVEKVRQRSLQRGS